MSYQIIIKMVILKELTGFKNWGFKLLGIMVDEGMVVQPAYYFFNPLDLFQ